MDSKKNVGLLFSLNLSQAVVAHLIRFAQTICWRHGPKSKATRVLLLVTWLLSASVFGIDIFSSRFVIKMQGNPKSTGWSFFRDTKIFFRGGIQKDITVFSDAQVVVSCMAHNDLAPPALPSRGTAWEFPPGGIPPCWALRRNIRQPGSDQPPRITSNDIIMVKYAKPSETTNNSTY